MTLQIGNIKGFTTEAITNIIYVLGMGYMGGSISALSNLSIEERHEIFPYDRTKLPYENKKNKTINFEETFLKYGIMEYIWPMKSLGFPYKNRYKNTEVQYQIINWMIDSCAYIFSKISFFNCSILKSFYEKI